MHTAAALLLSLTTPYASLCFYARRSTIILYKTSRGTFQTWKTNYSISPIKLTFFFQATFPLLSLLSVPFIHESSFIFSPYRITAGPQVSHILSHLYFLGASISPTWDFSIGMSVQKSLPHLTRPGVRLLTLWAFPNLCRLA